MNSSKINNTKDIPTTLTIDFLTFLDYIENHTVKLTKTNQQLTRTDLVALYAQMSEPKLAVSEKSNQIGYPLLHFYFQLAVELELVQKRAMGSAIVATIHGDNLASFKSLTATEQYVSLLECFWMKANWRELQGGRYSREPYNVDALFGYLESTPTNQVLNVRKDPKLTNILYEFSYFLLYFSYFGFWYVQLDEEERKENRFRAKSITLLPLYKQLTPTLAKTWESRFDDEEDDGIEGLNKILALFNADFVMKEPKIKKEKKPKPNKSLLPLLQPLFEDGQLTTLFQPTEKTKVAGEYLLKVSWNSSCWRTMQVSESHTLLDVHKLIQQAFEFADDHLYAFYMDGKKFSKQCYNSPMDDHGPYVNHTKIGDLHLYEGQRFLYLFDFGDEWEFIVDVIKITEGKACTKACIRQSKGESPEQYRW